MKRSGELRRVVPLARWDRPLRPRGERKAPSVAGPSREVRALVRARDGHACVCCGTSIIEEPNAVQFRKPERLGGSATPENLITVLHACGERINSWRDPMDEVRGYRLQPGDDPKLVPVSLTFSTESRVMVWLTRDGLLSFEPPPGA